MIRFGPTTRCSSRILKRTLYHRSTNHAPNISALSAKQIINPIRPKFHTVFSPSTSIRALHSTSARLAVSPFKLHDIGEGITEVEIIKWYVEEGQEVNEFDALCEVQSDKSVVELTSHANGIVKGISKSAGEVVKVGQVLCEIHTDANGEGLESNGIVDQGSTPSPTQDKSEVVEMTPSPESTSGANQGTKEANESEDVNEAEKLTEELEKKEEHQYQPRSQSTNSRRHPLHTSEDLEQHQHPSNRIDDPIQLQGEASILPSPPSSRLHTSHQLAEVEPRREGSKENGKVTVKASPAIRTLASRLGIDLNSIKGTGENGRILKEDIQSQGSAFEETDKKVNSSMYKRSVVDRSKIPEVTKVEFGRTRKTMFRALTEQGKIPHFGYSHTLDLTPLLPYLKAHNAQPTSDKKSNKVYLASDIPSELARNPLRKAEEEEGKQKTTILSFLIKGLILALEEHPIMRSRLKEENDKKWLEIGRDGIIGVAVSDPKYGLLTPSLPALPPTTSISEITHQLKILREQATKPNKPANITISSVGGLGESKGLMPIIPPGGGLAICAVGRASWNLEWNLSNGNPKTKESIWELDEGRVKEGGMKAVLRVPVGWSGDHRILEGAELISFTETWKKYIEEPWRWIMK